MGTQDQTNQTIDKAGVGVASAFGPWWGALAQLGVSGSQKIAGDNTNQGRAIAGKIADPFFNIKALATEKGIGRKAASLIPILGQIRAGKKAKQQGIEQKRQQEFQQEDQQRQVQHSADLGQFQQDQASALGMTGMMSGGFWNNLQNSRNY
jgi:uncharacterized membrane protein